MNAIKILVAAGFAIATTGAFAETGVKINDIGHVSNVYGRANVATVKIQGDLISTGATVADSGRDTVKGDTQLAVGSGAKDVDSLGRS